MNYNATVSQLLQRIDFHNHHLALLKSAKSALTVGVGLTYEVHIQANAPEHKAVMYHHSELATAIQKAKELWKACNDGPSPRCELFVRAGDLRIAIDPVDAGEGFTLDSRISNYPAAMVFGSEDTLPSAHYFQ